MNRFQASITYSKETLLKLEDAIYHAFGLKGTLIRGILGIAMIMVGIHFGGVGGMISIFLGALIATAGNIMNRIRGENTAAALKGNTIKVSYTFTDQAIRIESIREKGTIKYEKLIRLYEEGGYYFLFPDRKSGYMIDKKSIEKEKRKAFREFMTKKTGLEWTQEVSLKRLDIATIIHNHKNTKRLTK